MKFHEQVKAAGYESYSEYTGSEQWKAFRRRYRESGQPMTCAVCGLGKIQLHHHTYVRLGRERLTDVTPLCRAHHIAVHEWLKSNRKFVEHTHHAVKALGGWDLQSAELAATEDDTLAKALAKALAKILSLPSTKRQQRTARKLFDKKNRLAMIALVRNVETYCRQLQANGVKNDGQKKAGKQKPKDKRKKWVKPKKRPRPQPSTMSLIKSLIARGK